MLMLKRAAGSCDSPSLLISWRAGQISVLRLKTFNTLPALPLSLMVNSQKGRNSHFRLFSSDASLSGSVVVLYVSVF